MPTFIELAGALECVVRELIPNRHAYIVAITGPREIKENQACTVQLVPEHYVYQDRRLGMTLHLPFDPASGEFAHLVEFVGAKLDHICDEYKCDGIPCFAIRLGTDVVLAEKVVRFVLQRVYDYPALDGFEYEVYDEGTLPA